MKIKILKIALILLLPILATSCDNHANKVTISKHTPEPTHQVKSINGHYIVQWHLASKDIPYNEYFSIALTIKEPLKAIHYDVDIAVDAGMKAHNHGMHTRAVIKRIDQKNFIAEGMLFHMRGKWQIEIDITRGITRDKAIIEVEL